MNYDHRTSVKMGERSFVVEFDADGEVLRVKEIKKKLPPVIGLYAVQIWSAKSNRLGSTKTLPSRVIALARNKMRAEELAHNATP